MPTKVDGCLTEYEKKNMTLIDLSKDDLHLLFSSRHIAFLATKGKGCRAVWNHKGYKAGKFRGIKKEMEQNDYYYIPDMKLLFKPEKESWLIGNITGEYRRKRLKEDIAIDTSYIEKDISLKKRVTIVNKLYRKASINKPFRKTDNKLFRQADNKPFILGIKEKLDIRAGKRNIRKILDESITTDTLIIAYTYKELKEEFQSKLTETLDIDIRVSITEELTRWMNQADNVYFLDQRLYRIFSDISGGNIRVEKTDKMKKAEAVLNCFLESYYDTYHIDYMSEEGVPSEAELMSLIFNYPIMEYPLAVAKEIIRVTFERKRQLKVYTEQNKTKRLDHGFMKSKGIIKFSYQRLSPDLELLEEKKAEITDIFEGKKAEITAIKEQKKDMRTIECLSDEELALLT